MKRTLLLLLLLLPLLLTSCSNPDTSGGVTLAKGGDDANEFPHGSCDGPGKNPPGGGFTGCGWLYLNDFGQYFIKPGVNMFGAPLKWVNLNGARLSGANLETANLNGADLQHADLRNADLIRADLRGTHLNGTDLAGASFYNTKADRWTICPNGHLRGSGGDCPF